MQPEPSFADWAAATVAAVAIMAVGGQLLLGRVDGAVTRWSRITGSLVASLAAAVLLVAAVLGGAGLVATGLDPAESGDDRPLSGFARVLVDIDPDITERVAMYGVGLLVPLAAVLVVLALAAVDPARTLGLRVVIALVCSAVAVIGAAIALGDTGVLATRASLGLSAIALGALGALAADEIGHPRGDEPDVDADDPDVDDGATEWSGQAAGERGGADAASSAWRA